MLMIHEEAWEAALVTLKLYAGGKVPCKDRQRPAFEALETIEKFHPGSRGNILPVKEECKNANKNN